MGPGLDAARSTRRSTRSAGTRSGSSSLELRPSEYVRRQVRVTPYPHEDAGWIIEQAGDDDLHVLVRLPARRRRPEPARALRAEPRAACRRRQAAVLLRQLRRPHGRRAPAASPAPSPQLRQQAHDLVVGRLAEVAVPLAHHDDGPRLLQHEQLVVHVARARASPVGPRAARATAAPRRELEPRAHRSRGRAGGDAVSTTTTARATLSTVTTSDNRAAARYGGALLVDGTCEQSPRTPMRVASSWSTTRHRRDHRADRETRGGPAHRPCGRAPPAADDRWPTRPRRPPRRRPAGSRRRASPPAPGRRASSSPSWRPASGPVAEDGLGHDRYDARRSG